MLIYLSQSEQSAHTYVHRLDIDDADVTAVRAALSRAMQREAILADTPPWERRAWADLAGYPVTNHNQNILYYDIAQRAIMLMGIRSFSGEGVPELYEGIIYGLGELATDGINLQETLSRVELAG